VVAGYFTSVSLYYLGKFLFGKIAGFRLINYTFWFTRFVKGDKGIKTLSTNIEGLGCKVNMAPNKDKPNYKLYLFGGTIFSAPFFVIVLILFCVLDRYQQYKYYLLFIFSFIPFVIAGNLIPLRMDDYNEGFLLRLIKKDGENKWYRNLHQLEALTNSSSTLQFYEISGDELTPFDLDGLYFNYYYALDHNENARCNTICDTLIYNSKNIIDLSKIYCGFAGKIYGYCKQKRFDEADRFLQEMSSENRGIIKSKRRYESLKVALYLDAYVESNYDDYLARYFSKEKLAKHYKYLTRVENEEKLVEDAIKNIQLDHPDWYVK
jgi:pentatricopeptide repeat protein